MSPSDGLATICGGTPPARWQLEPVSTGGKQRAPLPGQISWARPTQACAGSRHTLSAGQGSQLPAIEVRESQVMQAPVAFEHSHSGFWRAHTEGYRQPVKVKLRSGRLGVDPQPAARPIVIDKAIRVVTTGSDRIGVPILGCRRLARK